MKLSNYLISTLFLGSGVSSITCPREAIVNQKLKVRDKVNKITWQPVKVTGFKGAFYQEQTEHAKSSFTCTYTCEDGTYSNLKLPDNLINRLNLSGNNWDNFYNPTLHSCDGKQITNVEDCSFTLKR